MNSEKYFLDIEELQPGDIYYTQLENWTVDKDSIGYRYNGKYVSVSMINELKKDNIQELINIFLNTYNIPVTYQEDGFLSLDKEFFPIIGKYIAQLQSQLLENLNMFIITPIDYYKSNNEKYNILVSSLQAEVYKMNVIFHKDNSIIDIKIKNLFNNIMNYINNIHIKAKTNEDSKVIWNQIHQLYIQFVKETYNNEEINQKLLYINEYIYKCNKAITAILRMKEYRYEDVSPKSPLGKFLALKKHIAQIHNNHSDKQGKNSDQMLEEIISELGKFNIEEFNQLNKEEFQELQEILASDEVEARELLEKFKALV